MLGPSGESKSSPPRRGGAGRDPVADGVVSVGFLEIVGAGHIDAQLQALQVA
jgi:hypothetical protein